MRRTCRSTPRRPPVPRYTNAGQALPAAESRQIEIGLKGGDRQRSSGALAAFDIRRPLFGDIGACDRATRSCTRGLDRRRSATAASRRSGAWRGGAWGVRGGAQWLHARVEDSRATRRSTASSRPTCPPSRLRLQATGSVPALAGLRLLAAGTLRERAQGAARQQRQHPERDARSTSARATRRKSAPAHLDLARRHRQPLRPARLARDRPTSSATSTCSRSRRARCASRCRSTSEQQAARTAGYNLRLFLDSSVGRAPDC